MSRPLHYWTALLFVLLVLISPCVADEWAIYCHGELAFDPRLSLSVIDPLEHPRIPWREFVVPDAGLYQIYYHSAEIGPSEREVLEWFRNEYCMDFEPGRVLVQLSGRENQPRARHVAAFCFAAHDSGRYIRADLSVKFDGEFFHKFENLRQLRHLELYQFDMNSVLFRGISKFTKLEYLGLPHDTSDEHLNLITELKKLKFLNMSDTKIHGESLGALSNLPNLRVLDLRRNQLDSGALSLLRSCLGLETLLMSRTNTVDEDVELLAGMYNLKYISLDGTVVTDKALEYLAQVAGLKYVSLHSTSTSQSAREKLGRRRPGLTIDMRPPRPLQEFITDREYIHAWLGHTQLQLRYAESYGRLDGDLVESLKWYLIVQSKYEKLRKPVPDILKARIDALNQQLNAREVGEAEARASAYLFLYERCAFNIPLEREEGLPLYQYGFGVSDSEQR